MVFRISRIVYVSGSICDNVCLSLTLSVCLSICSCLGLYFGLCRGLSLSFFSVHNTEWRVYGPVILVAIISDVVIYWHDALFFRLQCSGIYKSQTASPFQPSLWYPLAISSSTRFHQAGLLSVCCWWRPPGAMDTHCCITALLTTKCGRFYADNLQS